MPAFSPLASIPVSDTGSQSPIEAASTASTSSICSAVLTLGGILLGGSVLSTDVTAAQLTTLITANSTALTSATANSLLDHNGVTAASTAISSDTIATVLDTRTLTAASASSGEGTITALNTVVTPSASAVSSEATNIVVVSGGVASIAFSSDLSSAILSLGAVRASASGNSDEYATATLDAVTYISGATAASTDLCSIVVDSRISVFSNSSSIDSSSCLLSTNIVLSANALSLSNCFVSFEQQILLYSTSEASCQSSVIVDIFVSAKSTAKSSDTCTSTLSSIPIYSDVKTKWAIVKAIPVFIDDNIQAKEIQNTKVRFL